MKTRTKTTPRRVRPGQDPLTRKQLAELARTDFLGSPPGGGLVWATEENGRVNSAVTAEPWHFLVYRDARTFTEVLAINGRVRYPLLLTHQPEAATRLINAALDHLRMRGATGAYLTLPIDTHGPRAVVEAAGFELVGFRTFRRLEELVFAIPLMPTNPRCSLYRFAQSAAVRSTASGADAPRPDATFWVENPVYSGFSGYPFLSGLLDEVVPANCRRFLSVPCATGDAVRMLGSRASEVAVGLDLNPNALAFARARLRFPALDEVNARLNRDFSMGRSASRAGLPFARRVVGALVPGAEGLVTQNVLAQLSAAARFGVGGSNAVTDFWLVLKGLSELTGRPSGEHPLAWLADRVSHQDAASALGRLASETSLVGAPPVCPVRFEPADLLAATGHGECFDCVFCFEAALMFFAAGKQAEFLSALLERLAPGGRLILTGVGRAGRRPRELGWAAEVLTDRGLIVRHGVHHPAGGGWIPQQLVRPFPYLIADLPS